MSDWWLMWLGFCVTHTHHSYTHNTLSERGDYDVSIEMSDWCDLDFCAVPVGYLWILLSEGILGGSYGQLFILNSPPFSSPPCADIYIYFIIQNYENMPTRANVGTF